MEEGEPALHQLRLLEEKGLLFGMGCILEQGNEQAKPLSVGSPAVAGRLHRNTEFETEMGVGKSCVVCNGLKQENRL